MELGALNQNWAGCFLQGDILITDNREQYTLPELRCLRWERDNWRRLASVLQRELKQSGMEGSVLFALDDLICIRNALALLDAKLPGNKMQMELRRTG